MLVSGRIWFSDSRSLFMVRARDAILRLKVHTGPLMGSCHGLQLIFQKLLVVFRCSNLDPAVLRVYEVNGYLSNSDF